MVTGGHRLEARFYSDMGKYYAVQQGRSTGVYTSWSEAQAATKGYSGAVHKSFNNASDAAAFASSSGGYSSSSSSGGGGGGGSTTSSGSHSYGVVLRCSVSSYGSSGSYSGRSSVSSSQRSSRGSSRGSSRSNSTQIVYTDGSSRGNGRAGARAGYGVYYGPDDSRNVSEPLQGARQTNQRAELTAINKALDNHLSDIKSGRDHDLVIKTDSDYSKKSLTTWADKWEKNGYTSSAGKPVENSDLIKEGRDKISRISEMGSKVRLEHVRAHKGEPGNEAADRLANAGANK